MNGYRDGDEYWRLRRELEALNRLVAELRGYEALLLRYHGEALELLEAASPAAARLLEGQRQLEAQKARDRASYQAMEQAHKLAWRMRQSDLRAGRRGGGA